MGLRFRIRVLLRFFAKTLMGDWLLLIFACATGRADFVDNEVL